MSKVFVDIGLSLAGYMSASEGGVTAMRIVLSGVLALTLAGACANPSRRAAATVASTSSDATGAASRCAAVADSVKIATPIADLPIAVPQGQPKVPIPRNVPAGEIRTTFLVDPSGRAVRGSIVTTGGDQEYRSKMEEVVLRTRFRSPMIAECPSWGRGDFRLRAESGAGIR